MKILLNNNNVAIMFGGDYSIDETGITFSNGGVAKQYNTDNTTVIDVDPPSTMTSHMWKWVDGKWECLDPDLLLVFENAQKEKYNEKQSKARAAAYKEEADPIFFKSQRGEVAIEDWLAKIQEIKNRYPKN